MIYFVIFLFILGVFNKRGNAAILLEYISRVNYILNNSKYNYNEKLI